MVVLDVQKVAFRTLKTTPPLHRDASRFGAGNLQLSFSADTLPLPKEKTKRVFSVDSDIDLER